MMFAIIIFERLPLEWRDLGAAIQTWVQDAGGLAAVAILFYGLATVIARSTGAVTTHYPEGTTEGGRPTGFWLARFFKLCVVASFLSYILFLVFLAVEWVEPVMKTINLQTVETWQFKTTTSWFLTAGGAFALLAVSMPVLASLRRLSVRRIGAIARLSIKETIRQRVLWVFTILLLVVLFASWFLDSDKPEFQLRNYVWVVDGSTTLLLLLAASLLAAFSIPSDVRTQTIHTVVTKPVERFEIVLGRFVGYTLLMTAVLAVATGAGMLYLFRNINEEARKENYKARVPIYGTMDFKGTQGENVGREWTHRRYITGGSRREAPTPNYAVWSFAHLPERLAEREDGVVCEFSFDIYRTHKGEEGKGIFCTFLFVTSNCKVVTRSNAKVELEKKSEIAERQKQLEAERKQTTGRPVLDEHDAEVIANRLAEEFGFYEVSSQEVRNYHTQVMVLPVGLFKNMQKAGPEELSLRPDAEEAEPASLQIYVNVSEKSRGQLVGVARHDLYILDNEKTFAENFVKGAIGLWFRLCLLIGIAVACSTYLSGIISWMCTMFLFSLGLFKYQIWQVTVGAQMGGGPVESMLKLASGKPIAAELEKTPTTQVALAVDEFHRWFMNYLLNLIPDVNRFDLSQYVLNGFDISWTGVLLVDNLVPLLGYLIPCAIVAYYLIRSREIANPT
jgi:hypothetical protein